MGDDGSDSPYAARLRDAYSGHTDDNWQRRPHDDEPPPPPPPEEPEHGDLISTWGHNDAAPSLMAPRLRAVTPPRAPPAAAISPVRRNVAPILKPARSRGPGELPHLAPPSSASSRAASGLVMPP